MAQDVTLVTGASSGIGEALARRIAREGRSVVLVARRADRLAALAGELDRESGSVAQYIAADLTRPGAAGDVVAEVERRGLQVDWLVNNAGFGTLGRFHRLPITRELDEIRLNVEVLVELTGLCLPGMVARGRGAVINLSSVGGFSPAPYMATYGATKAFVLSFSEALSAELRDTGVHVLCVCPGFTRTEFQARAHVDTSAIPAFAWMTADEVADQTVRSVGHGPVLVNGFMNRIAAGATRFVPRGLVTRLTANMLRPQEAK